MTTDQQRLSAIQADAILVIAEALNPSGNGTTMRWSNVISAGGIVAALAGAGFTIEALSREGGEFDEAAAIREFEEYTDGDFDLSVGPTGQLVSMETYCTRGGWLARAEYDHAALTEARKRIAELGAAGQWRPIESAPLSGHMLILDSKWGVCEGTRYDDGRWGIAAFNGQILSGDPSAWMPMPRPWPIAGGGADD